MKQILIIEDDVLSQDVMRRIFKNYYDVDVCDSAEEYYEKFSETNYSIMIVDVSIQGSKNGLELVKEIKGTSSNENTPIICLTAHAQTKMRHTAFESGANLFMTKPVSNKVIRDAVAFLIK